MTQMGVAKLHKIASYSDAYKRLIEEESLAFKKAGGSWKMVREDWWYAFVFFLDQAYYTGRSDKLSIKFETAAIQALERVLAGETSEERLLKLKQYTPWL